LFGGTHTPSKPVKFDLTGGVRGFLRGF
jgi:hypothetical protein